MRNISKNFRVSDLIFATISSLLVLISIAIAFWRHLRKSQFFWDTEVYSNAAKLIYLNENPYYFPMAYVSTVALPFVSPPFIGELLGYIWNIFGEYTFSAFVIANSMTFISIIFMLNRIFDTQNWTNLLFCFAITACAFNGAGVTAALSGNLGVVMHGAIIAGLYYAVRTRSWLPFHLAVVVACLLKPPFAAYWLIPVFWKGLDWKQLGMSAAACATVGMIYVTSYALDPGYFNDWLIALAKQVTEGRDYGSSFFGVIALEAANRGISTYAPYIVHAVMSLIILLISIVYYKETTQRLAALLVVAVLANPRMQAYDVFIAAIPLANLMVWHLRALLPGTNDAVIYAIIAGIFIFSLFGHRIPVPGPFTNVLLLTLPFILVLFVRKPHP